METGLLAIGIAFRIGWIKVVAIAMPPKVLIPTPNRPTSLFNRTNRELRDEFVNESLQVPNLCFLHTNLLFELLAIPITELMNVLERLLIALRSNLYLVKLLVRVNAYVFGLICAPCGND